jgi:hypothetical protein
MVVSGIGMDLRTYFRTQAVPSSGSLEDEPVPPQAAKTGRTNPASTSTTKTLVFIVVFSFLFAVLNKQDVDQAVKVPSG